MSCYNRAKDCRKDECTGVFNYVSSVSFSFYLKRALKQTVDGCFPKVLGYGAIWIDYNCLREANIAVESQIGTIRALKWS